MAEIWAPIVNFFVVAFILGFFGRKPFLVFLQSRSEAVGASISEAENLAKESSVFLSTWESNWNSSAQHISNMKRDAEEALKRFRADTLVHAEKETVRIKREAEMLTQTEMARAKHLLQRELVSGSFRATRQYLSSNVEDKDRHKLVAQYLEKVTNGKA